MRRCGGARGAGLARREGAKNCGTRNAAEAHDSITVRSKRYADDRIGGSKKEVPTLAQTVERMRQDVARVKADRLGR